MHPYLQILGRNIPAFGLMALLGIGVGCGLALLVCKTMRVDAQDVLLTGCIAIAGAVAGAKLLKPIIRLPDILWRWDKYAELPVGQFFSWLFGETVFYGGLLGGVAAAYSFCRSYKIPFLRTADLYGPAIPAGHAIGRLGCLLAGCCYGVPVNASHPFAIIYPERTDAFAGVAAPAGVPLLAAPLIESAGNILIAAVVYLYMRWDRSTRAGRSIALYGMLYSVQRFILEFYRGDLLRGVYFGLSTSQIISAVVFVISLLVFVAPSPMKKQPVD